MTKVLVLYYSSYGHLETMANAVAEGAKAGNDLLAVDIGVSARALERTREDVPQREGRFEGGVAKDEQSITAFVAIVTRGVKWVSLARPPIDEFFEADGLIAVLVRHLECQEAFI